VLGPPKPRCLDAPITASLEDLIPPDHFYRHLEAKLDLDFVREWARCCMPNVGVLPLIRLIRWSTSSCSSSCSFEGIRSERKLIETASLNLAHRWYLGYARNEGLPGHFTVSRNAITLVRRVSETFTLSAR
jgi:hypothetical protein